MIAHWNCLTKGSSSFAIWQGVETNTKIMARVVNPSQIEAQNNTIIMSRETPGHNHNALAGAKRRLNIRHEGGPELGDNVVLRDMKYSCSLITYLFIYYDKCGVTHETNNFDSGAN